MKNQLTPRTKKWGKRTLLAAAAALCLLVAIPVIAAFAATTSVQDLTVTVKYVDTDGNSFGIADTTCTVTATYVEENDCYYYNADFSDLVDVTVYEASDGTIYSEAMASGYDEEYGTVYWSLSDAISMSLEEAEEAGYSVTYTVIYEAGSPYVQIFYTDADNTCFYGWIDGYSVSDKVLKMTLLSYDNYGTLESNYGFVVAEDYFSDVEDVEGWDIYYRSVISYGVEEKVFLGSYSVGESISIDLSGYDWSGVNMNSALTGRWLLYAYAYTGIHIVNDDATDETYTLDSGKTASIHCSGELENFIDVYVDGKKLTYKQDYTLEEGSTIVVFTESYLSTLSEGEHTVTLLFQSEDDATKTVEVATTLTVVATTDESSTTTTAAKATATTTAAASAGDDDSDDSDDATTTTTTAATTDSPNTGDDFNAAPFVALAIVSGAAATASAVLVYRKKKLATKAK